MFEERKKMKCTIFYENIEEAYLIENAKNLSIKELPYNQTHLYYGEYLRNGLGWLSGHL